MTCSQRIVELVECARHQAEPDRELRRHLTSCADCRERWDRERQLTSQLRIMRRRVEALGSPNAGRKSLMREFSQKHKRKTAYAWVWGLTAAAALLLAGWLGHAAGKRPHGVRTEQAAVYEASASLNSLSLSGVSLSNDASALSNDDFIAVPFTPPLATGELVTMVHTDMYPEALASLGVEVDPSWPGDLPVDVVVGEDGLPRAVRITENNQF
jgi:hypothetical protein